MKSQLRIYSFYRFKVVCNKKKLKIDISIFLKNKNIKGTILIANEGINGSISGKPKELKKLLSFIRKQLSIRKLSLKKNYVNCHPFNRMKVRLKKEIVSLGIKDLNVNYKLAKYIKPSKWSNFIQNSEIKLIDTRNIYEFKVGKFENSINPKTKSFREFPKKFRDLKIKKNDKIAMYCTGGIRCEKASSYLNSIGYKNVYQLEGGILNYLSNVAKSKPSFWRGECFVFDQRVTVSKKLTQGRYLQCYGCRRPITKKDTNSKKYQKGVSCAYCHDERTIKQKKNSMMRQAQIEKIV